MGKTYVCIEDVCDESLGDFRISFESGHKEGKELVGLNSLISYEDSTAESGDILPYGTKAVWEGLDVSTKGNIGEGSYAFVLDTGVNSSQTDLNLNTNWSKSFINGQSALVDGHGHGTHVSGTIGALSNGVGIVGVAPGAEIVPIKVLNDSGYGSWTGVIDGINYCVDVIENNNLNKEKVVINMSLGGSFNTGVDNAVRDAANKGISFAIAAGNSAMDVDAYSPAAAGEHENVYTISAVNSDYQMPYFSNWDDASGNDDVDYAAPGVGVKSYTKTGGISAWDGTSMAAPHVAGALLLGGIKEGDLTTPYGSRDADPFALVDFVEEVIAPPRDSKPPQIKGPFVNDGGLAHYALLLEENSKFVYHFESDEEVTWSIDSNEVGIDNDMFTIDSSTGDLKFKLSPDYENPLDNDKNNSYIVSVCAMDLSSNKSIYTLQLNIKDVPIEVASVLEVKENTNEQPSIERVDSVVLDSMAKLQSIINDELDWQIWDLTEVGIELDNTNCSNIDFIHSLYENILLREPDINGHNYWLGQLNGGIETRTEVFLGFAEAGDLFSANIDAFS